MLAEERASAQAAAAEAASRLEDAGWAATEERRQLQQRIMLLEQSLAEAAAVQEDLATRLQVNLRHMKKKNHCIF